MVKEIFLSIVIPAYNEAERLPHTLLEIDKQLADKKFTYEILVVNDGSKDNTAEVAKKMAGTIKNLKVVDNHENQGKGGVVRQGMLIAQGKYRLFTDADNSTSIDHFEKMIPFFEQGYDVVIGSRAIKGAVLAKPQPIYRQIPGRMGNLFIQTLLLPGIWDTQCGFKAFTAVSAEKIFNLSRIVGWGFDVEVLALAKHFGYRLKEVPVTWINDAQSHVKASAYIEVLLETVRIRWALWMGKYEKS